MITINTFNHFYNVFGVLVCWKIYWNFLYIYFGSNFFCVFSFFGIIIGTCSVFIVDLFWIVVIFSSLLSPLLSSALSSKFKKLYKFLIVLINYYKLWTIIPIWSMHSFMTCVLRSKSSDEKCSLPLSICSASGFCDDDDNGFRIVLSK